MGKKGLLAPRGGSGTKEFYGCQFERIPPNLRQNAVSWKPLPAGEDRDEAGVRRPQRPSSGPALPPPPLGAGCASPAPRRARGRTGGAAEAGGLKGSHLPAAARPQSPVPRGGRWGGRGRARCSGRAGTASRGPSPGTWRTWTRCRAFCCTGQQRDGDGRPWRGAGPSVQPRSERGRGGRRWGPSSPALRRGSARRPFVAGAGNETGRARVRPRLLRALGLPRPLGRQVGRRARLRGSPGRERGVWRGCRDRGDRSC